MPILSVSRLFLWAVGPLPLGRVCEGKTGPFRHIATQLANFANAP
jgi:hypothetical protein